MDEEYALELTPVTPKCPELLTGLPVEVIQEFIMPQLRLKHIKNISLVCKKLRQMVLSKTRLTIYKKVDLSLVFNLYKNVQKLCFINCHDWQMDYWYLGSCFINTPIYPKTLTYIRIYQCNHVEKIFNFGLPETLIELHVWELPDLALLNNLPPSLQILSFDCNPYQKTLSHDPFTLLPKLKSLHLVRWKRKHGDLNYLPTSLIELGLQFTELTENPLLHLINLRRLSLIAVDMPSTNFLAEVIHSLNLEHLALTRCKFGDLNEKIDRTLINPTLSDLTNLLKTSQM
eukprot:TRINITY_DN6914_c0_g1_i2.p1 TRINITY_DN6914_c0_g1~~TRINITY_DN6914_c0_g1_i2.p1  ORF type:complete len:295 (-),score=28.87 TRINITY_DN6914_c0_g1_i2:107-967(-)